MGLGWLHSAVALQKCMLQKPECQTWRSRQDDLRMQQTMWAKEMELRKAAKSLGDEIGWMVDSSQWEDIIGSVCGNCRVREY